MELPVRQDSRENVTELSSGNELTSDILRARALEYYNSFPFSGCCIQKSGSVMHVNGYASRTNAAIKLTNTSDKYKQTLLHGIENQRLLLSHGKLDRPQRSYSERTNRVIGSDFPVVASMAVNHSTSHKSDIRRSNSSLNLDQEGDGNNLLRRDFGSASSLDVISKRDTSSENFFIMLREYRNETLVQSSQSTSNVLDYPKNESSSLPLSAQLVSNSEGCFKPSHSLNLEDSQSPKLKTKLQRLWDIKDRSKVKTKPIGSEQSIFKKLRGNKAESIENYNKTVDNMLEIETRIEEKLRKKAFSHYDCQSITANVSYASRLCNLLSRRRNTTTGASAASMLSKSLHNNKEELHLEESDFGDGRSNALVLSCPFFRNELGGESERMISLNRMTSKNQRSKEDLAKCLATLHKPIMACGLSILENNNSLRWKQLCCPYQKPSLNIENVDDGAFCYRKFCYNQEHQNWFGIDETLGPVAISIKREKIEHPCSSNSNSTISGGTLSLLYQYRLIVRTSELTVLRGTISEEAIPSVGRTNARGVHVREVLEYVVPELQLSSLRLGISGSQTEEQLLKLDEQGVTKTYKVGIMYCKANQGTEEEMYNNEHSGPAFEEFLDMLGQRVRLKGFDKYRAGLDNKTDTTGLHSIYAAYQDCEIMFHVSTMLPYTPNNKQQLLRKRHIGNDIVTIVFQEPDSQPFTPKNIRSQFQHVFIVIRTINPCTEQCSYSIAVSRSKEVPVFGPSITEGATFPKSKSFADFLLAKVINAENAAHRSEKFATMAQRTRQEYLKDLAANYSTNTTIDSGPKFSILSFGGKKKERTRSRFIPDSYVQGAISWQVQVEDYGQSSIVECFLGISCDTVILIEESTYEVIFACPCNIVIGLSTCGNSLKLFYHQGECIIIYSKESEEIHEIVSRLQCVTNVCETQELILRRNSLGQLGFHVQYEGIVTEVESYGFAWQAGLRQGSRLVEICKIAVATLTYDQIVDLLKTSMTVTVTVIPPFADGSPHRGCALQNCSYLSNSSFGDYENVDNYLNDTAYKRSPLFHKTANAFPQCQASIKQESHTSVRTSNSYKENRSPTTGLRNNVAEISQEHSVPDVKRNTNQIHSSSPKNTSQDGSVYSRHGYTVKQFPNASPEHNSTSLQSSFLSDLSSPLVKPDNGTNDYCISNSNSVLSHLHCNFHNHGRNTCEQNKLTHIGGIVKTHSELSLPELAPYHARSNSHHTIIIPSASGTKNNSETNYITQSIASQSNLSVLSRTSSPRTTEYAESRKASPSLPRKSENENWQLTMYNTEQETPSGNHYCNVLHRHNQTSSSLDSNYDVSNVRSHSPRISVRNQPESHSKLNRLRPGVTSVNNRPSKISASLVIGGSSGSSCSGSTSTLQEDLLKLISPDFLDSDSNSESQSSSHIDVIPSETDSHIHESTSYSSLEKENECNSTYGNMPELGNPSNRIPDSLRNSDRPPDDVILTKAHLAQVISSEPSSPCPTESVRLSCDERLSPRVTTDHILNKSKSHPVTPVHSLIPLPETRNIDWPSLVDTATKAMENLPRSKSPWMDETTEAHDSASEKTSQVREFENTIQKLKQDLVKEQQQNATLEQKIQQLTEENQRLQAESHSTAAQLRRFTEWFFQNMEMHS